MTINLELSADGVRKAINEVKQYSKSIESRTQKLAEELCRIGIPVVNVHYLSGVREGNKDFTIKAIPKKNGCILQANGHDVCFLEFGAGVTTTSYSGEGQEGLPPIYPGSWSESEEGSGEFANNGFWHYGGKLYYGLSPKLGMYYASKEMQNRVVEVARRIFND